MSKNDWIKEVSKTIPKADQIVLVLQGGGALGAYQYGVYKALDEAAIYPEWVIGTSIGAINGGIIAGNPPEKRMVALNAFWDLMESHGDRACGAFKGTFTWLTMANGVKGFFSPNSDLLFNPMGNIGIEKASYYTTEPLRKTLSELIDFDYLNSKKTRLTVGAVNANTGEMRYFDNRDEILTIDHILASGALPPAFPAVRINGEPYWDGGIYSNTPIEAVLDDKPRIDSIIFSVQLWNPLSSEPKNVQEVLAKQKDIQFASRDHFLEKEKKLHRLRHVIRMLGSELSPELKKNQDIADLMAWGCSTTMHVIKLISPRLNGEDQMKDIDFTIDGITQRQTAGYEETLNALYQHPWTNEVDPIEGVLIHEFK
jgi:NTE family protein